MQVHHPFSSLPWRHWCQNGALYETIHEHVTGAKMAEMSTVGQAVAVLILTTEVLGDTPKSGNTEDPIMENE